MESEINMSFFFNDWLKAMEMTPYRAVAGRKEEGYSKLGEQTAVSAGKKRVYGKESFWVF